MNHLRLTKIGARNLKGLTFELDLSPVTFLVGPNYKGKTAQGSDAIRLLLIGYLPELGKRNSDTFGLSSGTVLEVYGDLNDGVGTVTRISRKWSLKGDSVKADFDIPPSLAKSALVETMLNADSWFGLTENERVNWVFLNVAVGTDLTPSAIATRVRGEVQKAIAAESTPEGPDLSKPIDDFVGNVLAKIRELERDDGPLHMPDFAEAAFNIAGEFAKQAREQATRAEKGAQLLAGLRAADVAPVDLPATEAKIAALKIAIQKAQQTKAAIEALIDGRKKNRLRRTFIQQEIAGKPLLEVKKKDREAGIAKAQETVEEVNRQVAALPASDVASLDELRTEERDASSAATRQESELDQVHLAIEKNEREKAAVDEKQTCPYCGAAGEGWKTLKLSEIDSAIAGLVAKRDQLAPHVRRLKDYAASVINRANAIARAINDRLALDRKLRDANETLELAKQALRNVENSINLFSGKEGELAAIPADDLTLDGSLLDAAATLEKNNKEMDALDVIRSSALGRKHDLQRLAEAEKARDEAKGEKEIAEAGVEALRSIKREMVLAAFAPIVEAANAFGGDLLDSPLAYNAEKASIGRWSEGLWIGYKTFSGVEKLIAFAAIQAAFASRSEIRVMILDEMLRAQDEVFDGLVTACKRAVRTGFVDGFVGLIPGKAARYTELAMASESDCQLIEIK